MPYIDRCKLLKDLCKTSARTPGESWTVQKCIEVVNQQPSADVVPRSESELAREIFAEIEPILNRYCKDYKYSIGDVLLDIAEAKKKYMEGKE